MSELKGTLLAIILTLLVFGGIATTLTVAYGRMDTVIEKEVSNILIDFED